MTDKIEALEALIEEASDEHQKIDAMNELAWAIRDHQTQKAESLSQEALELAQKGGKKQILRFVYLYYQ